MNTALEERDEGWDPFLCSGNCELLEWFPQEAGRIRKAAILLPSLVISIPWEAHTRWPRGPVGCSTPCAPLCWGDQDWIYPWLWVWWEPTTSAEQLIRKGMKEINNEQGRKKGSAAVWSHLFLNFYFYSIVVAAWKNKIWGRNLILSKTVQLNGSNNLSHSQY